MYFIVWGEGGCALYSSMATRTCDDNSAMLCCTGLLEGYDKLCLAAKELAPLLQQLETEHLQRFNLTWEVLNKYLYQSCVYTEPLVQNNLPHYIEQVSKEMVILGYI